MTEPEPPRQWPEYPPRQNPAGPTPDPDAPVDYPPDYPGPTAWAGLPPPVYPPPYPGYAPGPGYADPYDPYRPQRPRGTNGKAIGSLTCAILGVPFCMCFVLSLVAIVLGAMAMSETRRTGQAGFGLATAGMAIGVASIVLAVPLTFAYIVG
ncbi:DUF4190 domain-containing protein [Mycolicibacterium palauense]|uniref:DUF4190 domain-containing protein n=1 Tax=Mycolicibacterium palauense TaxID=2034511 RepID=UPI000BFEB9B9|nr:DUF4190 domain-containing protein [Mycolicibacterium palauense]